MSKYYSLQNYSTYSQFSGVKEPKEWAKRADELGHKAFGISEKQTLASLIEFQDELDEHDIQPILGEEFHVTKDVDLPDKADPYILGTLLIYATSDEGVGNLIELHNLSQMRDEGLWAESEPERPRIDVNMIQSVGQEGLEFVLPSYHGVGKGYWQDNEHDALEHALELRKELDGPFYLGVNPISANPDVHQANKRLIETFDDVPLVPIFDAHVPAEHETYLYEQARIADGGDKECLDRDVSNPFMPSDEQVESLCEEHQPDLVEHLDEMAHNLEMIRQRAEGATIETGVYHMPEYEPSHGDSLEDDVLYYIGEGFKQKLVPDADFDKLESIDQLREWSDRYPDCQTRRGIDESELDTVGTYIDRLEHEFEIIKDLGYLDYFLIVRQICSHIDNEGYMRGYARGSAGGSLFSYVFNITRVDPIYHGLLFERFLNHDRNDLPDIDIDFSAEGREEARRFCRREWGDGHICNIGTFDRFKIVSAVKTLGRGLDWELPAEDGETVQYTRSKINMMCKDAGDKADTTERGRGELEALIEASDEFAAFYERHLDWFEGVILPMCESVSTQSVHAAGTLVTRDPIMRTVPIWEHDNGNWVSEWNDSSCEHAGNPKFDFLNIEGVRVIETAMEFIEERHDVELPEIEDIPLDDEKALKLFRDVRTRGMFQARTYTQRSVFDLFATTCFDDVVIVNALGRPGPIEQEFHELFADIKEGREQPTYPHEDLKPVLGETFGLTVYQEQIMQIVKEIGGLSGSKSDYVRKATGKKIPEEMAKWESVFKEGGLEKGYDEDLLDQLWNTIVGFADYGFNKSHSVGYSLLTYHQAWLKARYPVEFWAAALEYSDDDGDDSDKSSQQLKSLVKNQYDIDIVYPTIFGFAPRFEPVDGQEAIYWPVNRIKGVGDSIKEAMAEGGRRSFDSMEHMVEEMDGTSCHMGVFKKLIKAGFFDPLGEPWDVRDEYFRVREEVQGYSPEGDIPVEMQHRDRYKWQRMKNDLYQMIVDPWKEVFVQDAQSDEGFHPNVQFYDGHRGPSLDKVPDDDAVFIGGIVDFIEAKRTKYGDWYCKMRIKDEGEIHTVMCWDDFWEAQGLDDPRDSAKQRPWKGALVEIVGKKRTWNDFSQVVVDDPAYHCRVIRDPVLGRSVYKDYLDIRN